MKALVIGESKYNFISEIENFFEPGSINLISAVESYGGAGPIMASILGKYGVDTYLGSVVGDDSLGSGIKKNLENFKVHTEYMETAYEKRTTISNVYISKKDKSITSVTLTKEPLLLRKTEFQFNPDIIVTDGYDYGASIAALNRFTNAIGLIKCNTYSKEIMELCKYCNYIIMSKEFAESVSGNNIDFENPNSLVSALSSVLDKFPGKQIVITIGPRGALYTINGKIKIMPGLKSDQIDNTGSGYYFTGAFVYAILNNYDIEKSITFANIVAGLSVSEKTTSASVAELSKVMEFFNQKYPDVNQAVDTL